MRLRYRQKGNIAKPYEILQARGKHHLYQRPYILPIFGLLIGLLTVAGVVWARDGQVKVDYNSHVVYVFDKGKRTTATTRAKTVGELVDKLPLNLINQDVIEPSRETAIEEDNFRINVYRARPVTVMDNGSRTITLTAQRSARVVAQDAGLTVYPEDNVNFAQGSLRENIIGEKVVVDPATPVLLNLYGTPLVVRTHSKTVADMLTEKRLKLDPTDNVQPALDTPITPNLQVFILRQGVKIATVEEPIPAPTRTIPDASLSFGARVIRQPGQPGKRVVTYQITSKDGIEVGRQVIQEAIVQSPVPQIVAVGTVVAPLGSHESWMAGAGINSSDYGYVNYIISRESGWCPTKWQGQVGYCPPTFEPIHPLDDGWGYGLGQATPPIKMSPYGSDWQVNPVTQLRWANDYAKRRFGSWAAAYNYWLANRHW